MTNDTSNDTRLIQLDDKTILTYDLVKNYIGSGILGDVYKLSDGRIAKIPRDASRLPQFKQEVAVLKHLVTTYHTPEIATGIEVVGGFPVIIMPYYDNKDLYIEKLAKALKDADYVGAEKLTLNIAIAFCDAMIQLHTYKDDNNKQFTCVDRKVIDFYLQKNNNAMILDWNVLTAYTEEFRIGEIRVFGTLLHEAYLGAKGKMPYKPFNDSRWRLRDADIHGVMSVGLRYILARMTGIENFYAEVAKAVSKDEDYFIPLKKHLQAWQMLLTGSINLLTSNGIERTLNIQNTDEVNAIYEDLRVRLGAGNAETRANALQVAHEAGLSATQKIRGQILDALRFNVDEARKLAPSDTADPHIKRWNILLDYKDTDFDSRKKAEIREWLISVGGELHTDESLSEEQLKTIRADYNALRQVFPTNHTDIHEVGKEIAIHEQADSFNREPSFDKQREILQKFVWDSKKPTYMTDDMLNRLLDGYFVHKLVDEEPPLTNLDDIRRKFALIQMATHIEGWGTWLKSWLDPIRKALQFISDYDHLFNRTPIRREDILEHTQLLGEQKALAGQLSPLWDDILRNRINLIANNYYHEAIRLIREATEDKKVNFDDLLTLKPLVNRLMLNIQSDDQVVVDKFELCYKENQEYRKFLHEFIKTPTDDITYPELATKLLGYLDNPHIDSRKETLIPDEKRLA